MWMSEVRVRHRVGEDRVRQPDDRLVVALLRRREVVVAVVDGGDRPVAHPLDHLEGGRVGAVGASQRVGDGRLGGDDGADAAQAARELEVVERDDVGRVRHRHDEVVVGVDPQRQRVVALGELARHPGQGRRLRADLGQVDRAEPELVGERLGDVLLGRQPHPEDGRAEAVAAAPAVLGRQGVLELGLGEHPGGDEDLPQALPPLPRQRCPLPGGGLTGRSLPVEGLQRPFLVQRGSG